MIVLLTFGNSPSVAEDWGDRGSPCSRHTSLGEPGDPAAPTPYPKRSQLQNHFSSFLSSATVDECIVSLAEIEATGLNLMRFKSAKKVRDS